MNRFFGLVVAFVLAFALLGTPAQAAPVKDLVCTGEVVGGTYKSVTVPAGESCTLVDAVVTHNFRARGAVDVNVLDTEVRRNLMVVEATGSVKVGNKVGCGYDPIVGNNIVVRDSHNVLICQMTVDNNIRVTGNDGRITVRDSVANGSNIHVSRNLAFGGTPQQGAIRIVRCEAKNHIQVFHNDDSRKLVLKSNAPAPVVR